MANPLWVPGAKSANPAGRPKHSVRTVKGMVERFVKRNITPNKLQKMFDGLTDQQKLNMLTELLPYVAPKITADAISNEEIERLYDKIQELQSNVSGLSLMDLPADLRTQIVQYKQKVRSGEKVA